MKAYTTLDRSDFPLVTVTFTGERANPENFQAYLDDMLANYDPKQPFVLVFDARKARIPAFKYQKMQADWVKQHFDLIGKYCLGTAYIIPGSVIRSILKAIFSLQKQPAPFKVFGDIEEGESWCRELLHDTQLQSGPQVV